MADVTAPPYDVISPAMQDELYQKHPCNVVRLILNRSEPGDESDQDRYTRAADFLRNWLSDGILMQERDECIYAYDQEFDWEGQHYVRRGFMARVRLEEFGTGQIFPHEETMSGPKADRLALIQACRTGLSPIFGLYPDEAEQADGLLRGLTAGLTALETTDELGVLHRMWPASGREGINQLRDLLREKPVFIADGHHRYETALNYRNWLRETGELSPDDTTSPANFVLMHFVAMSDPGLAILPTHRLVSGLPELPAADISEILSPCFTIEEIGVGAEAAQQTWEFIEADGGQAVFGLCSPTDGIWLLARLKDGSAMDEIAADHSEAWRELGVSVLHSLVLGHLIGGLYPEDEPQFKYVHRLSEVTEAVDGHTCELACLVPPARIENVQQIASGFEKMPPKSTYFYPKLLSGLVLNPLY